MSVAEQVTCSGLEFWGKKLHVQEARDNWERTFQWWLPTVGMAGYQMTYTTTPGSGQTKRNPSLMTGLCQTLSAAAHMTHLPLKPQTLSLTLVVVCIVMKLCCHYFAWNCIIISRKQCKHRLGPVLNSEVTTILSCPNEMILRVSKKHPSALALMSPYSAL